MYSQTILFMCCTNVFQVKLYLLWYKIHCFIRGAICANADVGNSNNLLVILHTCIIGCQLTFSSYVKQHRIKQTFSSAKQICLSFIRTSKNREGMLARKKSLFSCITFFFQKNIKAAALFTHRMITHTVHWLAWDVDFSATSKNRPVEEK